MNVINVKNLTRSFEIPKKQDNNSILTFIKNSIAPEKVQFKAIDNVSFKVKKGEIVGYLGPNGAGKSTTIKILTGILTPDSGSVDCLGYTPWKQRIEYTKNIGVIFGQRSLLWWDVPVIESFMLYKDIYEIDDRAFKERVDHYSNILNIGHLLNTPVRKLSLGERMKCNLASALLHDPKLLFMDEPTIGLDAVSRENMLNFIKEINKELGTTIFLTTHYMGDIEELCKRIIVLDSGRKVHDGRLDQFKGKYVKEKIVEFEIIRVNDRTGFLEAMKNVRVLESTGKYYKVSVSSNVHTLSLLKKLMRTAEISNITLQEPPLEKIMASLYRRSLPKS